MEDALAGHIPSQQCFVQAELLQGTAQAQLEHREQLAAAEKTAAEKTARALQQKSALEKLRGEHEPRGRKRRQR